MLFLPLTSERYYCQPKTVLTIKINSKYSSIIVIKLSVITDTVLDYTTPGYLEMYC